MAIDLHRDRQDSCQDAADDGFGVGIHGQPRCLGGPAIDSLQTVEVRSTHLDTTDREADVKRAVSLGAGHWLKLPPDVLSTLRVPVGPRKLLPFHCLPPGHRAIAHGSRDWPGHR